MVSPGDRVKMTGIMPNDPCPLPVGLSGTVVSANLQTNQIHVDWDEIPGKGKRSLILLYGDPFVITGRVEESDV